jgi:hypothetical protein
MLYFTGTDVAALTALTAVARTLLAATTQAAQRTALGLGTAALTTYEENTFTVTATGFSGTAPSGTATYVRIGKQVTVLLPALTGTSNATTFALTGWPAGLYPATAGGTLYVPLRTRDNTANNAIGLLSFFPPSTVDFFPTANPATGWTASGSKTLFVSAITYLLP